MLLLEFYIRLVCLNYELILSILIFLSHFYSRERKSQKIFCSLVTEFCLLQSLRRNRFFVKHYMT